MASLALMKYLTNQFKNNPERFEHSKRVLKMAIKLNDIHHLNIEREDLEMASLLHDYAKSFSEEAQIKLAEKYQLKDVYDNYPGVGHAYLGAYLILSEFSINQSVFDAVYYHTTGKPDMDNLTKVIFISDAIELKRSYPNVKEIRKKTYQNLDLGIYLYLEQTINYLKSTKQNIEKTTMETYEYYKGVVRNE